MNVLCTYHKIIFVEGCMVILSIELLYWSVFFVWSLHCFQKKTLGDEKQPNGGEELSTLEAELQIWVRMLRIRELTYSPRFTQLSSSQLKWNEDASHGSLLTSVIFMGINTTSLQYFLNLDFFWSRTILMLLLYAQSLHSFHASVCVVCDCPCDTACAFGT